MFSFSVVIPNWNGRKLLEKNLPKVLLATKEAEVIVVDDNSNDDSNEFLSGNYPQIKIVKHQKRLGFGASCNDGVKIAKGEIVVLFNLDVYPQKDFLKYTLPHFKDKQVFAVTFHEKKWSWAKFIWKNGFIEHQPGSKSTRAHISGWASGGSAAFRKSIWDKLGGFDDLYQPFYWEDIDLGYRAWKRGYKILWEPEAIVFHKHEGTIGAYYSRSYIDFISQRNQLLFIWKNITNFWLIKDHKFHLFLRLFKTPGYFKVLGKALLKLPQVLPKRFKEWREARVPDRKIFWMFKRE